MGVSLGTLLGNFYRLWSTNSPITWVHRCITFFEARSLTFPHVQATLWRWPLTTPAVLRLRSPHVIWSWITCAWGPGSPAKASTCGVPVLWVAYFPAFAGWLDFSKESCGFLKKRKGHSSSQDLQYRRTPNFLRLSWPCLLFNGDMCAGSE